MTSMIANQIGPYMYGDGNIADLDFGGRRFKVVIASARNAGIIGSEDNGVAILDVDHQNVVLDRHAIAGSGYHGPSDEQKAEFERIKSMDWAAFTDFVRSHRYYRGAMPDVNEPAPVVPERPDNRKLDFGPLDPDSPYDRDLPLLDRHGVVEFIVGHRMHRVDGPYSDWGIAWNVKVYDFDTSGNHEGFKPDPALDAAWEAEVSQHGDHLFWEACRGGLSEYLEGGYSRWDGTDGFKFVQTGRSGGWLVLEATPDLPRLSFEDQKAMKEFLFGLEDSVLARLYRDVRQIDADLASPRQEVEYQFAARRQGFEEGLEEIAAPTAG